MEKKIIVIIIAIITIIAVVGVSGCINDENPDTDTTSNEESIISVDGVPFNVPAGFKVNKDYDGFYNDENKTIKITTEEGVIFPVNTVNSTVEINGIKFEKFDNSVTKNTIYKFEKNGMTFTITFSDIDNSDDILKQMLTE